MEQEEKQDIVYHISGGNNQFFSQVTTVTQNNYDSSKAEPDSAVSESSLSPEALRLSAYINKVEVLYSYISRMEICTTVSEMAEVVMVMMEHEPGITKELVVKEKFISMILPFSTRITSGKSVENFRARINDALVRYSHEHR